MLIKRTFVEQVDEETMKALVRKIEKATKLIASTNISFLTNNVVQKATKLWKYLKTNSF